MNAPETGRLEQLEFDNSFAGLPAAFYTRLAPLGLPSPYLVGASDQVAELIGLDPSIADHLRQGPRGDVATYGDAGARTVRPAVGRTDRWSWRRDSAAG